MSKLKFEGASEFRIIEPDFKQAYIFATAWISAKGLGEEFNKALDENRILVSPLYLIPASAKLEKGGSHDQE